METLRIIANGIWNFLTFAARHFFRLMSFIYTHVERLATDGNHRAQVWWNFKVLLFTIGVIFLAWGFLFYPTEMKILFSKLLQLTLFVVIIVASLRALLGSSKKPHSNNRGGHH
jgi:hypothetical protein